MTPITEQFLLDNGFEKISSLIIDSYTYNLSHNPDYDFKQLSVNIEMGNQYVFLRQGDPEVDRANDDVITIYNSDYHGDLTCEYIQALLPVLNPLPARYKVEIEEQQFNVNKIGGMTIHTVNYNPDELQT